MVPMSSDEAPSISFAPHWRRSDDGKRVAVRVETQDFLQAMKIVNEVAKAAEELEHHPDLHIEQWNKLRIETYSHDVGGLTDRDARLARRIDGILAAHGLAKG